MARHGRRFVYKPLIAKRHIGTSLNDNLVAFYPLNEASGNALDSYGSRNLTDNNSCGATTGAIAGARTFVSASSKYFGGQALVTGDKVALSVSAWINRTGSGDVIDLGWGSALNNRFQITWYSDSIMYVTCGNGAATYGYILVTGTGTRHVVLIYDGSQSTDATRLVFYVNGVAQTLNFLGGSIPATWTATGNFELGRFDAITRFSDGWIDHVKIFERALTASDVAALYAEGAVVGGNFGLLSSSLFRSKTISGGLSRRQQTRTPSKGIIA